ncbi:AraC family transcriptional regulator [Paenibacillus sp. VCA1]|uniref:AraC family transcriptional regulator n=1 Tax=Paenibacillus sp. VCA1 TaxID=3039148 RepID=UPI002872767D|nr:AraC family transcriptional regulator [Paenibacillus sp. VCA1]MDR9853877.1 AraC family transcriptional regulator [Paenibacillus sp. VCA1]
MNFHARKPGQALARWIDKLWICEGYHPSHRLEFKLPDASLAWIINLKEDQIRVFESNRMDRLMILPGSIIAGPRSTYYYLDTVCQELCMGIQFKPGGALPFHGNLVGKLKDVDMPLEDGLGRHSHVDDLRERLQETSVAEERFQLVEQYLLRSLEKKIMVPKGHPAVAYALQMFEHSPAAAPSIAEIADMANLSTERYIRVFKEEVGLTPKNYGSIVRFQLALRMIREERVNPSIDMALSSGYYDQSHLYREFHKYANMSPAELFRRQDILENHVPL